MTDTKRRKNTKRNTAVSAAITLNDAGRPDGLTLQFANGQTIAVTAAQLSNKILEYAVWHGLKQKLVDAAAISRNPETGRMASIEDKYQAVKTVYDRLLVGAWNAAREGSGTSGGLLLQALVRMYTGRKTLEELRAFLADKTDAEKSALRKNPRVAQIIEDIRAEQGKTANIDTDELLEELNGNGNENEDDREAGAEEDDEAEEDGDEDNEDEGDDDEDYDEDEDD